MQAVQLSVTRVAGRTANSVGDFFDEFESLDVGWQPVGHVLCWLDKTDRAMMRARPRGWKICNLQRDFVEAGCPQVVSENLPSQADGSIVVGDVILGMMPITQYERLARTRMQKHAEKRRASIESVHNAGEVANRAIRDKTRLPEGGIVFNPNA